MENGNPLLLRKTMSKEAVFMDGQKFIREKIGLEYKEQWRAGDTIFIDTPTGSGKSHFILHNLLEYAILNRGKILYLVNRKVLQKQIQNEIKDSITMEMYKKYAVYSLQNYISVYTYQYIEGKLKTPYQREQLKNELGQYFYIVYDECHYFYMDSNFNTNTELSFEFLRSYFFSAVHIFISATMKNVKELIKNKKIYVPEGAYKFCPYHPTREQEHIMDSTFEYKIERAYDFVCIHSFDKSEDVEFIVRGNIGKNEHKWLIFTDSIKNGKKLQKELVSYGDEGTNGLCKDDVVFIDAGYEKEQEAVASVNTLVEEGYINKKVIIATPVLDNGISFLDKQLRNIVILSDTEEEFIQMLGRKRKDGKKIDVYICKRSINYFKKRKEYIEKILNFFKKYNENYQYTVEMRIRAMGLREVVEGNIRTSDNTISQDTNVWRDVMLYRQVLLDDILNHKLSYECARKVCYTANGEMEINEFSVKRLLDLQNYYDEIIKKMEEDENAFLKMQMRWMNKSIEEIDEIVATTEEELVNQYRERLKQGILLVLDENMSKEDCIEFKKKNKDLILYFLDRNASGQKDENEKKELEKMKNSVAKVDRTLTDKQFKYCMEQAELPYVMIKPDSSTYKIISELPEKM